MEKSTNDNLQPSEQNNNQSVEELNKRFKTILSQIDQIKQNSDNNFQHRISYLTWFLTNQFSLIVFPPLFYFGCCFVYSNMSKPPNQWNLEFLTNFSAPAITLGVFIISVLISLGGKFYSTNQEIGDMNIQKENTRLIKELKDSLESDLKQRDAEFRQRDAEFRQRDAEFRQRDAEYKAELAKRDERFESLQKVLTSLLTNKAQ
jgi:hypothetical protein